MTSITTMTDYILLNKKRERYLVTKSITSKYISINLKYEGKVEKIEIE